MAGIPTLRAIPSGEDLKALREASNLSTARLGAYLGAEASRVEAWEAGTHLPGQEEGGLSAALRLYGVLAKVRELREADTEAA